MARVDEKTQSVRDKKADGASDAASKDGISNATPVTSFKARLERFKHSNQDSPREMAAPRRNPKRQLSEVKERAASPSPTKKRRQSSKYAPPSKYAHLSELTDVLAPNLICVFVGFNPGVRTATSGHAYAHPSNLFWKLLHSSGCTDRRLPPEMDVDLPRLYSMGNTNIVSRPSKDAGELSKAEMSAGTPVLEDKVAKFRPEAVCIVGKGIWEAIWRPFGEWVSKRREERKRTALETPEVEST